MTVSAEFTAPSATAPGRLFITATIKSGWHIYSITQPEGGPLATKITLKPPAGVRVGDFQVSPPPKKSKEVGFGDLVIESHAGTVTWYAPLELAAGVDPASSRSAGKLNVQACDPQACYPPRDYAFTAVLGQGGGGRQRGGRKPAGCGIAAAAGQPESQPSGGEAAGLPWQPFTTIAALGAVDRRGARPGQRFSRTFTSSSPRPRRWTSLGTWRRGSWAG